MKSGKLIVGAGANIDKDAVLAYLRDHVEPSA